LNELTGGESLRANLALVKNNARVGAQVASVADPDVFMAFRIRIH
jgi:pseudouridine-5'-phosphate glycosidase